MALRFSSGFSLVEVTFAVALVALMIVSTSVMLQRLPIDGREVRDQDLALRIARSELETLRAAGYASLPASGSFTNSLLNSLSSGAGTLTVSTYSAKTKQVQAGVTWKGAGAVSRSVSLTTLVTQTSGLP